MRLEREDVVAGYGMELASFEALLRSLSDGEWLTTTRCDGWAVRDVAAHVVGTLTLVAEGRTAEIGEPDHVEKQVNERRAKPRAEVIAELEGAVAVIQPLLAALDDTAWTAEVPGGIAATIGDGVETLWYDTYVHADDIRAALDRPAEGGPGLNVAVAHLADVLTSRGWGPATLALAGISEYAVSGGGERITGDPREFILAATGRADPAIVGLDEKVNVYA